MSCYRAVIFDWDGTLVDSLDHITASLAVAADACGMPQRSNHELRDIIGLGLREALEKLWPGVTLAQINSLRQAYGEHFFSATPTAHSPYEGVPEMLQSLTHAGPVLAVATGKTRVGLDRALASTELGPYFRLTRCADETRSKPDPTMLREILQALDIKSTEALMIGDTVYDLEMAASIGMPSVGVTWGVHDAEALVRHQPVHIVDDVAGLEQWLAGKVRPFDLPVEDAVNE